MFHNLFEPCCVPSTNATRKGMGQIPKAQLTFNGFLVSYLGECWVRLLNYSHSTLLFSRIPHLYPFLSYQATFNVDDAQVYFFLRKKTNEYLIYCRKIKYRIICLKLNKIYWLVINLRPLEFHAALATSSKFNNL